MCIFYRYGDAPHTLCMEYCTRCMHDTMLMHQYGMSVRHVNNVYVWRTSRPTAHTWHGFAWAQPAGALSCRPPVNHESSPYKPVKPRGAEEAPVGAPSVSDPRRRVEHVAPNDFNSFLSPCLSVAPHPRSSSIKLSADRPNYHTARVTPLVTCRCDRGHQSLAEGGGVAVVLPSWSWVEREG